MSKNFPEHLRLGSQLESQPMLPSQLLEHYTHNRKTFFMPIANGMVQNLRKYQRG